MFVVCLILRGEVFRKRVRTIPGAGFLFLKDQVTLGGYSAAFGYFYLAGSESDLQSAYTTDSNKAVSCQAVLFIKVIHDLVQVRCGQHLFSYENRSEERRVGKECISPCTP